MSSNYTLKVVSVINETPDAVTLCFKQPALKKIRYIAGQYLTLIFNINGRRYIRPYSFSSAPGIDDTLNITVKRVAGGIVSNHIIDKVKVNDMLEALPPMGNFIFPEVQLYQNIVLWGSGSGITPLFSLLKYALNNNIGKHITLVYGNRNHESVIFATQIDALLKKFEGKFSVWHFRTQAFIDDINPSIIKGRIDPEKAISIIHKERDVVNSCHFICGPAGLKDSIRNILFTIGVSPENVFSEEFELIRDPAEFENVITRTVKLIKDEQQVEVEVSKGKSILEAGLDALLDLSYSCQTGNCLLCKGKLLAGETKTIGLSTIPNELSADERLLCCSYPLTDDILISV